MTAPQTNFLAVTGLVADPKGNLVKPPRGPLNLSWLFHVSAETARQAKEKLAQGPPRLEPETLAGWFCVASPTDLTALDHLEQRAWRKTMKMWKSQEGQRWAVHNRATLHRLMYVAEDQENRGGHLRKAAELYAKLAKEHAAYKFLADWSYEELRKAIFEAARLRDDEMVARSLMLVKELKGMVVCEDLQEELMLPEVDDLALLCATQVRELLPYQGVVHQPPLGMLTGVQETTELDVLPLGVRLAFRLVPGSRQRRRVDAMVAELCGLLAQSMFKAGEGRAGKKWQSEARRWEPKVAEAWKEPEEEHLGDESAPKVEFSQPETLESQQAPRSLGTAWLGVHARPSLVRLHETREEWLEALRVLSLPIFPLRRYAVYRNLDTGDIGSSQRLPLKPGHYLWQVMVVVLLSLTMVGGLLRGYPELKKSLRGSAASTGMDRAQRQAEVSKAVERLKRLAEAEAELRRQPKPDPRRIEAIETERQALIEKVEQLERGD